MPEHSGEKIHDATAHRRQQAREKGQVACSQDLGSAALLIAGVLLLMALGGGLVDFTAGVMRRYLGQVPPLVADAGLLHTEGKLLLYGLGRALLPLLGLVLLAGVLANVFQVGLLWLPHRPAPDLSRVSPLQGLRRIFSLSGMVRLGFGLLKVLVIVVVAGAVLWMRRDAILQCGGLAPLPLAGFLVDVALGTMLCVGLALLALAGVDYAFQRWKHEHELRMTDQEVREEMKNLQGDPQIAARRRSIQRQLAFNPMSSAVPQADVILTSPTESAVALRYKPDETAAPVVVAKGAGAVGKRIRQLALEKNIPIVERKQLAQSLYKYVDVGKPIAGNSYAAVAEVLAHVYERNATVLPKPPEKAA